MNNITKLFYDLLKEHGKMTPFNDVQKSLIDNYLRSSLNGSDNNLLDAIKQTLNNENFNHVYGVLLAFSSDNIKNTIEKYPEYFL